MSPDLSVELLKELHDTAAGDDVEGHTRALARLCWWDEHAKACPPSKIPTPQEIWGERIADTNKCPLETIEAALTAGTNLVNAAKILVESHQNQMHISDDVVKLNDLVPDVLSYIPDPQDPKRVIENDGVLAIGKCWDIVSRLKSPNEQTRSDGLKHPLAPLMRTWQDLTPIKTEPDRKPRGIIGRQFADRHVSDQETLPNLDLPEIPGPVEVPDQQYLPGLLPEERGERTTPGLMLALFDAIVNPNHSYRPSSHVETCIFVEALTAAPTNARDGLLREMTFPIREIVRDWLQWKERNYRPNRDDSGGALQRAILQNNERYIPMNDREGGYLPLIATGMTGWRLKDRIAFGYRLPPGSGVGPAVDRVILRRLAKKSPVAYRAYLSLCFEWDYHGASTNSNARPGRKRQVIRATRPVVRRNDAGHVLDAQGRVVTTRGGAPVTSPYDRRAVSTGGREPNPKRTRYPEYSGDDLIRLCFGPRVRDAARENRSTWHVRLLEARKALEFLAECDGCTIDRIGIGQRHSLPWRILPYDADWTD